MPSTRLVRILPAFVLVACGAGELEGTLESEHPDASTAMTGDADAQVAPPPNDAGVVFADARAIDASPPDTALPDTAPVTVDSGEVDAGVRDVGFADASESPVGVPVIHIAQITGATDEEIPMIEEGVAIANATMATTCFRDFVLGASWTETEGMTQAEIWELLSTQPVTVTIDMFMGTWYQNHISRTIGYEDEPGTVHMNRYFVDTAYEVADNVIHEAEGHSQGFSHYGVHETSVPYGLNSAFEACEAP